MTLNYSVFYDNVLFGGQDVNVNLSSNTAYEQTEDNVYEVKKIPYCGTNFRSLCTRP